MPLVKLKTLADERDIDFASREHKSLIAARLIRSSFTVANMRPIESIESFLSPCQSRLSYTMIYLRANKKRKSSLRHLQKIYTDTSYCDYALHVPLTLFNKYVEILKNAPKPPLTEAELEYEVRNKSRQRRLYDNVKELVVLTLDFTAHPGCLLDTYKRTRVPYIDVASIEPILFSMTTLIEAIHVNFSSREQIISDELSFSANGFGGVVMALDFKQRFKLRNSWIYVMNGSNFDGRLRHLELIRANSEGEAFRSSRWYQRLCLGDTM